MSKKQPLTLNLRIFFVQEMEPEGLLKINPFGRGDFFQSRLGNDLKFILNPGSRDVVGIVYIEDVRNLSPRCPEKIYT